MNILYSFYNNIPQREAVKAFMVDCLKEIAVERAFEGKSTEGIQEANECVEKSFNKLSELYGIIKEQDIPNAR